MKVLFNGMPSLAGWGYNDGSCLNIFNSEKY